MTAAVPQQTPHRHQNVLLAVAVFCCMALMSVPAAAVQWNRVGVVTTLTNNQLCKTDGTNVICDSTTPTISSGQVGIGSVGPISSLDMSQKTDAVALPVGTSGNRPTGGNLTAGEIRYNSGTPGVEAYVNGAWVTLQSGSGTWSGGTITVPYGGTGDTTLTAHGVMLGEGASSVAVTAAGATGTVLIGNGSSADPSFSASPSVTNLTLAGVENLTLGSDYTTTGLQADVSLGTASSVRYNGSGVATFYGIVAGASGQVLYLHNASSSVLTLSNKNTINETTPANEIITGTGADLNVPSNTSVTLQYDGNGSIWRVTGSSNAAVTSLSGLTPALATNSFDNANYAQTWTWNTLTTQNAMTLRSSSETTGSLLTLTNSNTTGTGNVLSVSTASAGAGSAIAATNSGSSNTGYAIYGLNNSTTGWGEYQAGTSPNYFAGKVGIGTTAPGGPLDLEYTHTSSGNSTALLSNYTMSASTNQPVFTTQDAVAGYITIPSSNSHVVGTAIGGDFETTNNSSAGFSGTVDGVYGQGLSGIGTANWVIGGDLEAYLTGGTVSTGVTGVYTYAEADTGTTTADLLGGDTEAYLKGGTITNGVVGEYGYAEVDSGTAPQLTPGDFEGAVNGGTVTDAYGVYTDITSSGGTITNYYGVYIDTDATATNKWGLYQNDATAKNYFAGKVGIGTTAPGSLLDIGSSTATPGVLQLESGIAGGWNVKIQPSASQTASWTMTLPATAGTNTYVLQTNGSGVTSWVSAAASFTGLTTGDLCTAASGTAIACAGTLSGDVTSAGGTAMVTTLATVNTNVGSFGSSTAIPNFTVNGKGLITAAGTNVVIAPAGTLTGTTLDSNVVTSSLTSVGTITTGVWNAGSVTSSGGLSGTTGTYTGAITDTQSIGVTSTNGLVLTNTTAAALGAQQWSPRIHFDGRGWETGTSASQLVDMIEELQPVQGATNPSGNLVWSSSVNTGAYAALMTLTTGGNVGIGTTSPATGMKADINGPVKVAGTGSEACTASTVGAMRYNPTGQYMEICTHDGP